MKLQQFIFGISSMVLQLVITYFSYSNFQAAMNRINDSDMIICIRYQGFEVLFFVCLIVLYEMYLVKGVIKKILRIVLGTCISIELLSYFTDFFQLNKLVYSTLLFTALISCTLFLFEGLKFLYQKLHIKRINV